MKNQTPIKPRENWNAPIINYDNLTFDTCKLIFDQSKDYFEETVKESEELTQRSIRFLLLFISGVFAVVAYVASNFQKFKFLNSLRLMLLIACVGAAVSIIARLFQLMGTKNIHYRGSKPETIMRPEILKIKEEIEVLKALYISEIEYYQVKIDQNEYTNWKRILLYKEVIRFFTIFVGIGITLFILSIAPS